MTAALLICCYTTVWLGMHGFYISLPVSVCLLLYTAYRIYRYILRSTRAMAQFIWSVRYSEFLSSPVQSEESLRSLPAELLNEMNQALDFYKQNLQKKESKLQYFQALANHIDMSVLVYTPSGRIEWMNEAAKRLLDNHNLKSIDELKYFHSELPARLYSLKAGDISVLQAKKEEETIQLALSGMEFVIQGRPLTVASMKNIHSVLDSQETEAWQKLIRVLTHEIMNSITPVTSLSELLEHQIEDFDGNEEERAEIRRMLQTIRRRGDGLIRFVNSYREVSHLPHPLLKIYTSQELLTGVVRLMYREPNDLHLILPPKGQRLMADKDLIEQVLINLIKNARENDATDIRISAGLSSGERPYIRIEDNGTGIEQEVLDRIFIPFFTTKPTGSGIGLTISRQIMHLHRGTDQQFALIGGKIRHLPGGVQDYLDMTEAIKNGKDPFADEKSGKNGKTRKNGDAGDSATTAPSVGGAASSPSTGDSSSASTPKLTGKAFHEASKRVAAIERKLAKLGEQKADLEAQMAAHDPSDYEGLGKLNEQLQSVTDESESLEMEWMELSEQLE